VAELQGFCKKNTTPCTFKKSNNIAGVWRFFFAKPVGPDLARAWAAYLCFKVLLMIPLMFSDL